MRFRSLFMLSVWLLAGRLVMADDSPGQLFPKATGEATEVAPTRPRLAPPPAENSTPGAPSVAAEGAPAAPAGPPVAPAAAVKKAPIPSGAGLKTAMKEVNETYQDELAKAGTQAQQAGLAKKLLQTGIETTSDAAGRYALFIKAREIAVQAGDISTVLAIIAETDRSYEIDALKVRAEAAAAVGERTRNAGQRAALVASLASIVDEALAGDRYDVARAAAGTMQNEARATGDAGLQTEASGKVQQVFAGERAYEGVKGAMATLVSKPTDPEANLKVGKFRCFIKGDWDGGLPMLVSGSDPQLKALATRELAGATDAEGQVALGDAWWAAGEKEAGAAKMEYQVRGGKWYGEAETSLTGLVKSKVDIRLKSLGLVEPAAKAAAVNLLKLVDAKRDAVGGEWALRDGTLTCGTGGNSRIEFLYEPPAEYDYKVVFTPTGDIDVLVQHVSAGGRQFLLGWWGNKNCGFEMIKEKGASDNPTTHRAEAWFVSGRQYTTIVKVRKDRVQAYLDGKLIVDWKTDYSDMSLWDGWRLTKESTLGLGATGTPTVFHTVEVVEITGHGRVLK